MADDDPISLTDRFVEAVTVAHSVHDGEARKGTHVPYLAHPLGVAALVLEDGGDEDEAIAAVLHDTVEHAQDAETARQVHRRIVEEFGELVGDLVLACTDYDPYSGERGQWKERKQRYLDHLDTTPVSTLRISAAEKLHNAAAILRDLRIDGDAVWDRLEHGRDGQLWYYRQLADRLADVAGGPLVRELNETVTAMEEAAGGR